MSTLIVGVVVALASLLGTIIVGRLQHSGRIGTSEAAQLWAKTDKIEANLQAQIAARDARIIVLESRVATLESERATQREEHLMLTIEHQTCQARIQLLETALKGQPR